MQPYNYSPKAIEALLPVQMALASAGLKGSARSLELALSLLMTAPKYALPNEADIFDLKETGPEGLRLTLPHPEVVLEYSFVPKKFNLVEGLHQVEAVRRIALVWTGESEIGNQIARPYSDGQRMHGLFVLPIFAVSEKDAGEAIVQGVDPSWTFVAAVGFIPQAVELCTGLMPTSVAESIVSKALDDSNARHSDGLSMNAAVVYAFPEMHAKMLEMVESSDMTEAGLLSDLSDEMFAAIKFSLAMSDAGVPRVKETLVPAPKGLNQKRALRGLGAIPECTVVERLPA